MGSLYLKKKEKKTKLNDVSFFQLHNFIQMIIIIKKYIVCDVKSLCAFKNRVLFSFFFTYKKRKKNEIILRFLCIPFFKVKTGLVN